MSEDKFENLMMKLQENLEMYQENVMHFILYFETGVWRSAEKPDGEWLMEKMKESFEKPILDHINQ
jgi:hypothetical protein|tara:strand:+ start:1860 stop:2057 length:198 start_codon:yes stop_codon:yes gene_type:complete